jgi:thiol-disulfide isomerase/thioredoxin
MKKTGAFLFFVFVAALVQAQQNFEVLTKKPIAGSTITIEYMPRNTALQGHNDFEAIAYLLEGAEPQAKSITLKQQGGLFRGTVKTNDSTKAVFFSFVKDELRDNNNEQGYYTPLYDKKGNLVPGAQLAIGNAFYNFASLLDLKRNKEKAAEWMKKEFASASFRTKHKKEYLQFLSQSGNEADKAALKAELEKTLANANATEEELTSAKNYYQYSLADKEKADAVAVLLNERFPNGNWKRREITDGFFKAKGLKEKEAVFTQLTTGFGPPKKEDQELLNYMAGQLARMYADSGDYTAMKKYVDQINGNASKAGTLNAIAWKLAGEGLTKKPGNVDLGLQLSERSMELVSQEMREMKAKYSFMTEKQYIKNLKNSYHTYADTYGVLLYHKGEYDKAYEIVKKSVDNFSRKNNNINENFAALTEKVKGKAAAQAELEKFLEEGKYTPAMKEQLKAIYLGANNTEAQWTAYVSNLEERAYNKLKAELLKKLINQPAPQFALKDMSGKEVALSSLKGKVVVVDFWATWCGPCIASFPGMQKAVDRFKNNPDVVFLFIDTWENDSNRVQKVTDFIAKNGYNFNVLYDEAKSKTGNDFTVIEDYKVDGIPTKFVIDRNNNIRFKSVGYNGSAESTFNEVTAMIDIAAAESGQPIKKAF